MARNQYRFLLKSNVSLHDLRYLGDLLVSRLLDFRQTRLALFLLLRMTTYFGLSRVLNKLNDGFSRREQLVRWERSWRASAKQVVGGTDQEQQIDQATAQMHLNLSLIHQADNGLSLLNIIRLSDNLGPNTPLPPTEVYNAAIWQLLYLIDGPYIPRLTLAFDIYLHFRRQAARPFRTHHLGNEGLPNPLLTRLMVEALVNTPPDVRLDEDRIELNCGLLFTPVKAFKQSLSPFHNDSRPLKKGVLQYDLVDAGSHYDLLCFAIDQEMYQLAKGLYRALRSRTPAWRFNDQDRLCRLFEDAIHDRQLLRDARFPLELYNHFRMSGASWPPRFRYFLFRYVGSRRSFGLAQQVLADLGGFALSPHEARQLLTGALRTGNVSFCVRTLELLGSRPSCPGFLHLSPSNGGDTATYNYTARKL